MKSFQTLIFIFVISLASSLQAQGQTGGVIAVPAGGGPPVIISDGPMNTPAITTPQAVPTPYIGPSPVQGGAGAGQAVTINGNGGVYTVIPPAGPAGPATTVTGTVYDPAGAPVADADLFVLPATGAMRAGTHRSDANGHYTLTWGPRMIKIQVFAVIARSSDLKLALIQELKEDATNIDLHLKPALIIGANIEDSSGKPIANATAQLIIFSGNSSRSLIPAAQAPVSDDQGHIQILAVAGAHYNLTISAKGYGSASQPVQAADTQGTHYDFPKFVLKTADRVLAGQVLDVNGNPAGGARVQTSGIGQPTSTTQADSKGNFKFDAVCEGPVTLFAYPPGGGAGANAQANGGDTNVVIRFTQNVNQGIVNQGPVMLNLSGTVFDPAGKPASGVQLSTLFTLGFTPATSDANGHFTVSWRPRPTPARATAATTAVARPNTATYLLARDIEHNFASYKELDTNTPSMDIHLEEGLKISVTVKDSAGNPVQNANMRLLMRFGTASVTLNQQMAESLTDSQGAYEYPAMPQGLQYTLNTSAAGFGSDTHPVPQNQTKTDHLQVAIMLKSADRTVAGTVLGSDGNPMSGVTGGAPSGVGQPTGSSTTTDSSGHFELKVTDGSVRLTASQTATIVNGQIQGPGGGPLQSGTATVQAGATDVVIKMAATRVTTIAAAAVPHLGDRTTPLKPQLWTLESFVMWPIAHPAGAIAVVLVQILALGGAVAGIFLATRKRKT